MPAYGCRHNEVHIKATFFPTPADFRKWLEKHHDTADELLVGFYKKGSGKPSITWPESVDEALWVMSAKKEETRLNRLATLIDNSAHGRRIGPMRHVAGSQ